MGKPLGKTWATFNSILAQALISSQDITVLSKDPLHNTLHNIEDKDEQTQGFCNKTKQMKELRICAFACRVCGECHDSFILQVQVYTWISGTLRATFHPAGMSSMHPFYKQNYTLSSSTWEHEHEVDDADHYDWKNSHWWQISNKYAYDLGFIQIKR